MHTIPTTNNLNRGFTIVELLIVVVVIAILAAITVVSYNGITASASDSARLSDAGAVETLIRIKEVETGSSQPESLPANRNAFAAIYNLQSMGDSVYLEGGWSSTGYTDFYGPNKSKIYVGLPNNGTSITGDVWWSFWSNKESKWIMKSISPTGVITTTKVDYLPLVG